MRIEDVNWAKLREPFGADEIKFRIQSTFERNGETSAVVVTYVDARAIQDRLDDVVGPENWSFDWTPLITTGTAVMAAKGTLTIFGVPKSDAGDAGDTEPTKASVSDAQKRAAVQWGMGRELYSMPTLFAKPEKRGKSWILPDAEEARLRAKVRAHLQGQQQQDRSEQRGAGREPSRGGHQAEYKGEASSERVDEPVATEQEAAEPNVPMPAGQESFWKAPAIKDHQLELVAALREAGYTQVADVRDYLNQLVRKPNWVANENITELSRGEAKWMTRALHKLVLDDLEKKGKRTGKVKQPAAQAS